MDLSLYNFAAEIWNFCSTLRDAEREYGSNKGTKEKSKGNKW
jgi:hypothetical protein